VETERPYQLTRDLQELTGILEGALVSCHGEARSEDVLDAYLLAAGISQIVDDYRHRELATATKLAARLARRGSPRGQIAADVVKAITARTVRSRDRTIERRLAPLHRALMAMITRLANAVVRGIRPDISAIQSHGLIQQLRSAPARLRAGVLILPQCFFSFDMKPEDLGKLVEEFSRRWPGRDRTIAVVGIRTSGSYLAPLVNAYLRQRGYRNVETMTWRATQPWLSSERRALNRLRRNQGLLLLTDDPPTSGTTLATAAASLERNGIERSSLVLLLQLFDSPKWWTWPVRLAGYQQVLLPYSRWEIHKQLSDSSIRFSLSKLLGSQSCGWIKALAVDRLAGRNSLRRVKLDNQVDGLIRVRSHVRARYETRTGSGTRIAPDGLKIVAQGVGLGYFGRAAFETARRLEDLAPKAYGVQDGLLFRDWAPESQYAGLSYDDPAVPELHARYAFTRAERLPLLNDLGPRVVGRDAMWQRCSDLLTPAFGALAPLARVVLGGVFKQLMRPSRLSLIDGRMERPHWLEAIREASISGHRKVDGETGAYWSGIAFCSDPSYDLAAGTADREATLGSEHLRDDMPSARDQFLALGGTCSEERWLLNQLLYLRGLRTQQIDAQQVYERAKRSSGRAPTRAALSEDDSAPAISDLLDALGPRERQMSRLLTRYLAKAYPASMGVYPERPVCAIDVDGVLETSLLGFPASTPDGVLALRALQAHGHAVVLASGRSLAEVRERCRAYQLPGGVAEYGSVVFITASDSSRVLLSEGQRANLAAVSEVLRKLDGIYVDPLYSASVRAYRLEYGARRGLDWPTITLALSQASPGHVVAIQGTAQTDFIAGGIDKGVGLLELLRELEATGSTVPAAPLDQPIALAVGDTVSDWPMFRLASHAFAVGNAADGLRKGLFSAPTVRPLPGRYQAGLSQAVSHLLGHRPGRCSVCRPPALPRESQLLLTMLAAQNMSGPAGLRTLLALPHLANV